MKSVVLEMSVLSDLPFFLPAYFMKPLLDCCSCVEISWLLKKKKKEGESRIGLKNSGYKINDMGRSGGGGGGWGVCL